MSKNIPIWRIKYLPRILEDFCGREEIKERLKEIIKQRNFPHLLIIGAEGIGKTTLANLFAKGFLGGLYDTNFKSVYANIPLTQEERKQARSEAYVSKSRLGSIAGRTITTPAFIQVKIKPFVQLKVLGDAPFKILVVKNFEALGSNQQGFRRLMEIYGSNCRMILITTKISGVIDPILSRCQVFLISSVDFDSFKTYIKRIAEIESIDIEDRAIEILYKISNGKISKAIDLLQLSSVSGTTIDLNNLFETSKRFQDDSVKELITTALKGDFPNARKKSREIISDSKYNAHKLFLLLLTEVNKLPLSKYARTQLINIIADADFRAIDGIDDDIQISALLSQICLFSEYLKK